MSVINEVFRFFVSYPSIFLIGVCLYLIIFFLSLLFSTPKPDKNPFTSDTSKPPKEYVSNPAERDRILKQAFHQKRIPDKIDAIVIGSGIGGLTVANILARIGRRVLVLEQHDQAGGCCHTFVDKGFEFDVGIHYIGEMRNNTVSRLLVNQLTEGQLEWVSLDETQDIVAIGEGSKAKQFPQVAGKEAWKQTMLEKFPDEEKALDRLLELLKEVRMSMMGPMALKLKKKALAKFLVLTGLIHRITKYFTYANRSLKEVLDELTDNEDLKAVLSYSFGDYGTVPDQASFAMHATLMNHYLYGSSYPRGGASEFAFHMIPVIERAGGRVLVRAPVSQILLHEGKAIGVRIQKSSGDVDLYAPLIISDAGLINTFKSLLPKEIAVKSSMYQLLNNDRLKSGNGAMSVFVGLKGTSEELGLKKQNMWAFTKNDLSGACKEFFSLSADEADESSIPLLFISFPSTKDPTFQSRFPGKSTCTIVTLANWEWFEQWKDKRVMKRGEDYEALKNGIGKRMWDQVLGFYPQLRDKVEFFEVGSPLSNQYYIAAPKGEIYGLDHSVERFGSPDICMTMRPETDISGLLMTGQDIFSCGFMGAMLGGVLTASRVLNRNVWEDLVNLKRDVNKKK